MQQTMIWVEKGIKQLKLLHKPRSGKIKYIFICSLNS